MLSKVFVFRKSGLFLLFLAALSIEIEAQTVRDDYQYTAAFLDIPLGARALALGGQFTPIDNIDGTAFFWNPAAVSATKGNVISTMYSNQFGTIGSPLSNYFHIGYSHELSSGFGFSVNWIRNSVSNIPLTGAIDPTQGFDQIIQRVKNGEFNLGEFNNADDALFLTFGKNLLSQVDFGWQYFKVPIEIPIGLTIKYINQSFGGNPNVDYRGSGIGVDLGTLFKMNLGQLFKTQAVGDFALGFTIRDLFNTPVSWNTFLGTRSTIQRSFLVNLSYKQQLNFISSSLLVSYTFNSKYQGENSIGVEYKFQDIVTLRAGTLEGNFTIGAGIAIIQAVYIDYAYQANDLGGPHRVGLTMNLAKLF
ncbi:MAG: hypothetical protein SFU91_00420 [Chloroherpetonaceae bacterium]|nr:hypothetical protein [Chloroherpetonaceae bacterium]